MITLRFGRAAAVTAMVACAGALPAQTPPSPDATHAPTAVTLTPYSEELSRAAFTAIDRDGDDRLSIFEARQGMATITTVREAELFRRLDGDTDGYLEWPEFDQHVRETEEIGKPLVIHPVRPLPPPATPAPPDEPSTEHLERQLLQVLDSNRDGVLTTNELAEMLEKFPVPLPAATSIDRDGSGAIESAELTALAKLIPTPKPAAKQASNPLPGGYGHADGNRDGALDLDEMTVALRRLDPSLARWGDVVVRGADRNRNANVGASELHKPGTAPSPPTPGQRSITFPGQKPKK